MNIPERMMLRAVRLLPTLTLCLLSPGLKADVQWYQLEIIVFEQDMPNSESFSQVYPEVEIPATPAFLSSSRSSLSELLSNPVAYARVNPGDRLLNGTYSKLERYNSYRPLLHESWIQPASANRINRGVYLEVKSSDGSELLTGVLKIQRGHYLHLLMDMEYSPGYPASNEYGEYQEPVRYRIKEKRRTRLNEIQYLDHPKFGIILTIKPLSIN